MREDQTRVQWWLGRGPSPDEFRELFVEPFNASQDRVRLDLRVLTTAAREQTVEALEAGTGPDLLMVPRAGDFHSLVRRDYLRDLTPWSRRHDWPSRLLSPALQMATVDGRLYGVPRSTETMMLLFDPSILGQPPTSLRSSKRSPIAR